MIPIWAKPGAKCIFVGGGQDKRENWPEMTGAPIHGITYTIRDTEMGSAGSCSGMLVIRLQETVCRPHNHGWEDAWLGVSTFRPLITEADDIDLFKSLLNPTLVDKLDLLAERMNELAED
jgi:hypothetical protein